MDFRVKIFSTTTCPYCQLLKKYLTGKGVAYTEAFVDKNAGELEEMLKESGGFAGVPFTLITRSDGSKAKIEGFDKPRVDNILEDCLAEGGERG